LKDNSKTRNYILSILVILAVAFVLRLGVSFELLKKDSQVSSPSSVTDMATYRELSEKIFDGRFDEAFYYQPFYYAVFLPLIILFFGKGVVPVIVVQSVISSITVLFIFLSASMLKGRRSGIFAGLLAAFSSCLCIYVPYLLIETLQAFWVSMIVYLSILCVKRQSIFLWVLCGITVSFSILTRGNIWFFVPGLLLLALVSGLRKGRIYSFVLPAIFIIALLVPQIPFSYWNWQKTGKISGASTAAGAVLGLGNTPEAPPGGRNPGAGPGPMEYPEIYTDWVSNARNVTVLAKIKEWAFEEPLAFVELQLRKILLFWDSREIPNNIAFEHQGRKSVILSNICIIPSSILICGFFSSLISYLIFRVCSKKAFCFDFLYSPFAILLYFAFAYCLGTAAFYNLSRFRNPSLPIFAIFAGCFIEDFFESFRVGEKERKEKIKVFLIGILFSIFIVFFSYDIYRNNERFIMRIVRPKGTNILFSDNTRVVFDNGPVTFGGWQPVEIKNGTTIKKSFVLKEQPKLGNSKLKLTIYHLEPGELFLDVDGVEKKIFAASPGINEHAISIDNHRRSELEIKFKPDSSKVFPDGKVFFILDRQRDYGRTLINDKTADGELVCRLYYGTK